MAVKKNNDYFEMLVDLIGYSCEAASLLDNTISNFRMSQIDSRIKDMHKIEHNADIKKHEMINKLSKEFITPIERGDIIELANEIDNVTDAIEDVLVRIYMFNISVMREEAVEFSKLIVKICNETSALIKEFRNFKKSSEIRKLIINISDLEEGKTFKDLKLLSVSDVNKMSFTTVDGTISIVPSDEPSSRIYNVTSTPFWNRILSICSLKYFAPL